MNKRFETFTVLIAKIHRNIKRIKNQEMAEYGLRSTHVSCLYYLYTTQCVTATDLCEKCEEDKATISRSLDLLEKNGYLTYEPRQNKRYKAPLLLTPKGREVAGKIADKVNAVLDEISLEMTEEERVALYQSLATVSEGLEVICRRLDEKEQG